MADTEGIHVFRLNPPFRKIIPFSWGISRKTTIKYQMISYNFQIEPPLVNLIPLSRNPGSASTIYFIYMGHPIRDPYGTRLHSPYGSHVSPIWVPYRLLAEFLTVLWVVVFPDHTHFFYSKVQNYLAVTITGWPSQLKPQMKILAVLIASSAFPGFLIFLFLWFQLYFRLVLLFYGAAAAKSPDTGTQLQGYPIKNLAQPKSWGNT